MEAVLRRVASGELSPEQAITVLDELKSPGSGEPQATSPLDPGHSAPVYGTAPGTVPPSPAAPPPSLTRLKVT